MRLLTRSLLTVSVIALAAAVAWPQSLAEIAAREKERQEKVKKKTGGAAHVITEDDLRGRGAGTYSQPGAGSAAATPSASPSPGASPGAEKPKTEDEIRAEQEKAWRERLEHFQAEVARLTGVVASIQTDLGDLSGPMYGGSRTSLLNRLDTAQKSLAQARQQVEDLQEEGRRNRYR
jgi:hypothetical protein